MNFSVSGYLWNRSLVMMDVETKSLWSHILGRCMRGPLEGQTLETIPSVMTDWATWKVTQPETTVAMLSRTSRDYTREFLRDPSLFLIGIAEGREAKAWAFDQLQKRSVVNDRFAGKPLLVVFYRGSWTAYLYERLAKRGELSFRSDEGKLVDEETGSEWNPATGQAVNGPLKGEQLKPVPGVVSYRTAWMTFHPTTQLWTPE